MNVAKWTNEHGFVTFNGHGTQNDALWNAFYIHYRIKTGTADAGFFASQMSLYSSLIHPNHHGLLRRSPDGGGGLESHDNTKAVLWISKVTGWTFAHDWLKYGRQNGWNVNSEHPDKWHYKAVFERFPSMIAQGQVAAGEEPGIIGWLSLCAEFILAANSPRSSKEAVYLPLFQALTVQNHNPFCDDAIRYWEKKTWEKYPEGLGEMFEDWGWPKDHPYCTELRGILL